MEGVEENKNNDSELIKKPEIGPGVDNMQKGQESDSDPQIDDSDEDVQAENKSLPGTTEFTKDTGTTDAVKTLQSLLPTVDKDSIVNMLGIFSKFLRVIFQRVTLRKLIDTWHNRSRCSHQIYKLSQEI